MPSALPPTTTFGRWLAEHGNAAYRFAHSIGRSTLTVYRLSSPRLKDHEMLNVGLLRQVSKETGIPIGTLVEEACNAPQNPGAGYGKRQKARRPLGDAGAGGEPGADQEP